jgi:hypothetical protein
MKMQRFLSKFIILAAMLIGLPLLGILMAGYPIERYLEFPPETRYIDHASFSWPVFFAYTAFIGASVILMVAAGFKRKKMPETTQKEATGAFPWWGWLGIAFGCCSWILAWTRFPWFSAFQPHTFTPLWLSLILTVNALTYRQTGRCIMTHRTGFFLFLFPFSALFWWFFEFLNRFVQNWYYVGVRFGPLEYFWYATLPFSTVRPAVLSVQEWMHGFGWLQSRFHRLPPIRIGHSKAISIAVLSVSGLGLAGIGIRPDTLFSLLWISPLLIMVSLQCLADDRHVLSDLADGNGVLIISSALAALFCGVFWETWNFYSLAKWKYTIPFVDRFHVFEMPLLGYAGYLPFGLECMAVGRLIQGTISLKCEVS